MSRGWAKASVCRLQITLPCAVLCHIVSLEYLSRSSLHRLLVSLVVFSCHGFQVVTREVHRSSLRRLICSAQDHFIFLTVLIISMTFVLSLTQMLVFLSLHVMSSILLSIFVCAAACVSYQRRHEGLASTSSKKNEEHKPAVIWTRLQTQHHLRGVDARYNRMEAIRRGTPRQMWL